MVWGPVLFSDMQPCACGSLSCPDCPLSCLQSLHGKLVAAQSSAPAPRPVLAPIENAVLSRAASTEDSCTGQGSSSPTKEAPRYARAHDRGGGM